MTNQGKIVWRLVLDPARPKSYFHPLATIDGRILTACEPADHPWHRGLWWSWKFINGVNYWEEDTKTGKSAGLTALKRAESEPGPDFSARVRATFEYHPPGQDILLTESRELDIHPPTADGSYSIDWRSTFTAAGMAVKLDRTLPPHDGGPRHGGYAGLSLRLARGLDGYRFVTTEGPTTPVASHGKPAPWMGAGDETSGIAIFDHPSNPRHAPPWYLHSDTTMLFFSPSPVFNTTIDLAPRQSISFRYRIIVNSSKLVPEKLRDDWREFAHPEPNKP